MGNLRRLVIYIYVHDLRKDKRQRFADEGEKEIQVGYSRGDDVVHVSSVLFFL